jgi:hypothetical protein
MPEASAHGRDATMSKHYKKVLLAEGIHHYK